MKTNMLHIIIMSVLLYAPETWNTMKSSAHKLETFVNRCIQYILHIKR